MYRVKSSDAGQKKRVTLVDVAKFAGVSRSTVSLVIRKSPLIANATRVKVLDAMEELGYVHNRAAASLRSQRSRAVGLVITTIINPFFSQMAVGTESALEEADYSVLLGNTSDQVQKQEHLLKMMHGFGVDGLILVPAMNTELVTLERLQKWQLPCVLVTRYLSGSAADYVGADNVLGAEQATEHLVAHGHRRIAFIGGPANSSARRDRYRGYQNVLERREIKIDPSLSITSPISREGGRQALLELLAQSHPPTAALCFNDLVAFGVMLGLRYAGRAPGIDFDVIGFDDIEEAALWQPSLSSVAISPHEIGARAARLLLERIEHPEAPPRHIILPPRLVIRQSCAT